VLNSSAATSISSWDYTDGSSHSLLPRRFEAKRGSEYRIDLGNGEYLEVDADGKVTHHAQSTRIYEPCRRYEFNPFVNASDIMEEFVEFVAALGVRRQAFLELPLGLFVKYLILRSAEKDGDDLEELGVSPESLRADKALVASTKPLKWSGRCLRCGRYVKRERVSLGFAFCSQSHGSEYAVAQGLS
jgi:hypothetical protein